MSNPTPEALARAADANGHSYDICAQRPCLHCESIALALDAYAAERERSAWEAAAKFVDTNRCRDSFRMAISCGHVSCDYPKAVANEFRVRAAAQGGTG
jgi:hypothetical protein